MGFFMSTDDANNHSLNFDSVIAAITPETYDNLKRALELGKWADGTRLTQEQREHVMSAVIAYGERHLAAEQRVGFIDRGSKQEGERCDDDEVEHSEQPVKFLQ